MSHKSFNATKKGPRAKKNEKTETRKNDNGRMRFPCLISMQNPKHRALNPEPHTLNHKPHTLNPEPQYPEP